MLYPSIDVLELMNCTIHIMHMSCHMVSLSTRLPELDNRLHIHSSCYVVMQYRHYLPMTVELAKLKKTIDTSQDTFPLMYCIYLLILPMFCIN